MNEFINIKLLSFDWDEGNKYKNVKKHLVSNKESEELFFNKPIFFFKDSRHSKIEKRFLAYGKTNEGRLLIATFTMRGEKLRVISARDMNKKERAIYEK
jgi:uncharacterized protein